MVKKQASAIFFQYKKLRDRFQPKRNDGLSGEGTDWADARAPRKSEDFFLEKQQFLEKRTLL